jgi:hypothetical protein
VKAILTAFVLTLGLLVTSSRAAPPPAAPQPAAAQSATGQPATAERASPQPVSQVQVEIYRIAPGEHQNFLRLIARYDEANRLAGMPPRQLYVHQDGASWDFIIIQPAETTPEQRKSLQAAVKQLGIPQGANFFFEIRRFIAEHTDTSALGPTTAADWLARTAQ